jgi:hypothetical protein
LFVFLSCLFVFLVDNTHILNPTHVVTFAFDYSTSQLVSVGLVV